MRACSCSYDARISEQYTSLPGQQLEPNIVHYVGFCIFTLLTFLCVMERGVISFRRCIGGCILKYVCLLIFLVRILTRFRMTHGHYVCCVKSDQVTRVTTIVFVLYIQTCPSTRRHYIQVYVLRLWTVCSSAYDWARM